MNALLDAYFELGELIPQLYAYYEHCISNEYMRTVLALIYQDILDFHAYAFRYFKKSSKEYHCLLIFATNQNRMQRGVKYSKPSGKGSRSSWRN